MSSQFKIAIANGNLTMIYGDDHADFIESAGVAEITRASHVEPDGTSWVADMSPVGGPKLPACRLRQEALDAEVEYLTDQLF